MIAKISSGASPAGLANYLHGPGRENEHYYGLSEGGCVIGGNLMVDGDRDGHRWARDMHEAAKLRPEVGKPVWHMSLRAAPEDPVLRDEQWCEIAQRHGEAMGWADHPWVVVRHGEDHVHVVVSRVDFEGRLWSNSNDRYKARAACLEVEKSYGLRSTELGVKKTHTRTAKLTQGEFTQAERTGTPPSRTRTADLVRAARDHAQRTGGGRERFEAALTDVGVQWRANIASTGRMNGYSFHVPGHVDAAGQALWWKASDLDRSLSWGKLSKALELAPVKTYVQMPQRKRFERSSSYAGRVREAEAQALTRVERDSARQMTRQVYDARTSGGMYWRHRQIAKTKRVEQWVHNVHDRAKSRAQAFEVRDAVASSFPNKGKPWVGKTPTSKSFTTVARSVSYAAQIARAASRDEPRRGRGLSL